MTANMNRRIFLASTMSYTLSTGTARAAWFFTPFIVRALGRMALRGASRLTLRTVAKTAPRSVARGTMMQFGLAASKAAVEHANIVPYGARPEGAGNRDRAISLLNAALRSDRLMRTVATKSVVRQANLSPDDGPLPATIAYYYLLKHGRASEEHALWVAPKTGKSEPWRDAPQDYRVRSANTLFDDGVNAAVYVDVEGRNLGEDWRRWRANIFWTKTDYGWLITEFTQV